MTRAESFWPGAGQGSHPASALELRGVCKRYASGAWALGPLDLQVQPGRLCAVLGPSGCGKSTLLRLLAGLDQPDCGEIRLHGLSVVGQGPERRAVGVVAQSQALFPFLNVVDNVCFSLRMNGQGAAEQHQAASQLLQMIGMRDHAQRFPHELSGGEQQRVAIARALASRPRLLLLDEPLSSLDRHQRRHLRDQIRDIQQRLAITVVHVTHDPMEALSVGDQVVVMSEGKILQSGDPSEVYRRPVSSGVAATFGEASLFHAHYMGPGVVALGGYAVSCPAVPTAPPGAQLDVWVRPCDWRIAPASNHGVPGRVLSRAYLGATTEYQVQVPWGQTWVQVWAPPPMLAVGAPVSLELQPSVTSQMSAVLHPQNPGRATEGTDSLNPSIR